MSGVQAALRMQLVPCDPALQERCDMWRRTVQLPEGASQVAAGCVIRCCGRSHRHHRAAKALPLWRSPCPDTGAFDEPGNITPHSIS